MARIRPPDDDLAFDLDSEFEGEDSKDLSVIFAEAAKIKADAAVAVMKVAIWEDAEAALARANELTAWGRRSDEQPDD